MSAQPLMTPDRNHDLIVHLLHSGGALWVPGAKPHARNEPVSFTPPQLPTTLYPHPLNPAQAPVLLGTIPDFSPPGLGTCKLPWPGPDERGHYWCVALSHLAHGRAECDRCEPVWRRAEAQWSAIPDDGARGLLFGAIELSYRSTDGSTVTLLIHVDDVPDDWFDA